MATRSFIVWDSGEEKLPYRYHHWDGYVDGLGETLFHSFKTPEDVQKIFEEGRNMSTINQSEAEFRALEEEVKVNKTTFRAYEIEEYKAKKYHYVFACGQVMKFFKDEVPVQVKKQFTNLKNIFKDCDEEYVYLYTNKTKSWLVSPYGKGFMPLAAALFFNQLVENIARPTKDDYKKYKISQKSYSELTKEQQEESDKNLQTMHQDILRTGKKIDEFIKNNKKLSSEAYEILKNIPLKQKKMLQAHYGVENSMERLGTPIDFMNLLISRYEAENINKTTKKTNKKKQIKVL